MGMMYNIIDIRLKYIILICFVVRYEEIYR